MTTTEFVDRYLALWHEPDPHRRRAAIADLWTEDGEHILQPPQEMRDIAARPGLGLTAILEARGHVALEARVASAYREFVAPGQYSFRRRDDAERVRDVVKFRWELVSSVDGGVEGTGLGFLVLAPDGRIRSDYQFIES